MKMILYFFLLVALWVAIIPALNSLQTASSELRVWFLVINIVVSIKLLVDVHTSYIGIGPRGFRGAKGEPGKDGLP